MLVLCIESYKLVSQLPVSTQSATTYSSLPTRARVGCNQSEIICITNCQHPFPMTTHTKILQTLQKFICVNNKQY